MERRTICIQVRDYLMQRAGESAGASGSDRAAALRLTFDKSWAGLTKTVYFTDAREEASTSQVLGLGDRRPVESEERYITDWMDKGFPPETVALAYDKTVFYKKELNWRYLNGILRRWHENGWHTEEEVRQSDSRKSSRREEKKDDSRMEKYMKW